MNRRIFIALLVITVACVGSQGGTVKPNFVFILSDDQDWTGLSVRMHPDMPNSKNRLIETPNIERLAGQGMVFSAAYAPAPVCSPTRISLQTGKSPAQLQWTKASPVVTAGSNYPLLPPTFNRNIPPGETTIAEMLKTAGYATAHYGKWHLSGGGPENHGYDESDGDTGNEDAAPHVDPNPSDIFGITERANAFMEKNTKAGKPFFMQLSHHALHYPENAIKATIEKYKELTGARNEQEYLRMAISENLDSGVGLVMQKIDELGIGDRTYLIYMSDNGGVRVPAVVSWPGVLPAGGVCTQLVSVLDWLPTLSSAAGIVPQNIRPLDGVDKWDSITNNASVGDYSFLAAKSDSMIIKGEWKLVYIKGVGTFLYNIISDPYETVDVSGAHPGIVAELEALRDELISPEFKITHVVLGADGRPVLTWNSDTAGIYDVETCTSLYSNNWTVISGNVAGNDRASDTTEVIQNVTNYPCFFRIREQ